MRQDHQALFRELDPKERRCFVSLLAHADEDATARIWEDLTERAAKKYRMRVKFFRQKPKDWQIDRITRIFPAIASWDVWNIAWLKFYRARRSEIMAFFLDRLGIDHDGNGLITQQVDRSPDAEALVQAMEETAERFGEKRVSHYMRVLLARKDEPHSHPWQHLEEAWERYRKRQVPSLSSEGEEYESEKERDDAWSSFTTLDEVVLRAILHAAAGDEELGALSAEKVEDLVEELVAANNTRARSYFHLGFAESIVLDRPLASLQRREMNDERRAWYLCGALAGLYRRGLHEELARRIREHRKQLRTSLKDAQSGAIALAEHLFVPASELGEHDLALEMLRLLLGISPYSLVLPDPMRALRAVLRGLDVAERLLHEDREPEMALRYLVAMHDAVGAWSPSRFPDVVQLRLQRRLAQAQMQTGHFRVAERLLHEAQQRFGALPAEMLADLACAKAGLRSLADARLPRSTDRRVSLLQALTRAEEELLQATQAEGARRNAHYLLALLEYCRFCESDGGNGAEEIAQRMAEHARIAVAEMASARRKEAYERMGVLQDARLIELMGLVHALDPSAAVRIGTKLDELGDALRSYPPFELARLLQGAVLLEDDTAMRIAAKALQDDARAEEVIVHCTKDVLQELLDRGDANLVERIADVALAQMERDPGRWFDVLRSVLQVVKKRSNWKEGHAIAEAILDRLDVLAEQRRDVGEQVLQWLETTSEHLPFWDEQDALWARIRIARRLGKDDKCVAAFEPLFFRLRDEDPKTARSLIERYREWRLDKELPLEDYEKALPVQEREEDPEAMRTMPLRIVFVGGDERQQRYPDQVRNWLRNKGYENIQVDFLLSGWGSNWSKVARSALARIENADGLVLMSMMRTHLGRTLRREASCPWVTCTGTGKKAIIESILEAARLACDRHQSKGGIA